MAVRQVYACAQIWHDAVEIRQLAHCKGCVWVLPCNPQPLHRPYIDQHICLPLAFVLKSRHNLKHLE